MGRRYVWSESVPVALWLALAVALGIDGNLIPRLVPFGERS